MKKAYLLFCSNFLFCTLLIAQWKLSDGPEGAYAGRIVKTKNSLIAGTNGGIYKSLDHGETWEMKSLGLPRNGGVFDLVYQNGILYASISTSGIYISENEAESWTAANREIEYHSFYHIMVSGSEIYAGYANRGVFYSGDGGRTWRERSNGISDEQVRGFAYFDSAIYAVGRYLYKSIDNGISWKRVEIDGLSVNGIESMFATESALHVFSDRMVFRASNDTVWNVSPVTNHPSIIDMKISGDGVYLHTNNGQLYYTQNEGLTWFLVHRGDLSIHVFDVVVQDEIVLMASEEGIFSSSDLGSTWEENNSGIHAVRVISMAGDSKRIFAGTENQGIFRYTVEAGWMKINSGLNEFNAKTVYEIIMLEDQVILGTGGGVYELVDSGDEWIRLFDPGINKSIQALDYDDGVFVAAVSGSGVYIALNGARNFVHAEASGVLTEPTGYESILIDGSIIVLSARNGKLFLSQDLGNSWTDISIGEDRHFAYDLHFSNGILYAATSNGVRVSDDLGLTWEVFNNGPIATNSMIITGNKVYVSTWDGSVFVTSKNRDEWYDVSNGLESKWLNGITLIEDKLYAATNGASVWELPIVETNLPPIILGAELFSVREDSTFFVPFDKLTIDDENDLSDNFHLTVLPGENYFTRGTYVIPDMNFNGIISLPIVINDGIDDSPTFTLNVEITPVNDPPKIIRYLGATTISGNGSIEMSLNDFIVYDVDNDFPDEISLRILEGEGYRVIENRVFPNLDFVGLVEVKAVVNDGELDSDVFVIPFTITEPLVIDSEFVNDHFSIYPNPSSETLIVKSTLREEYVLNILELNGHVLFSETIGTDMDRCIDVSSLSEGVYVLQFVGGGRCGVIKLMIRK